MKEPSYLRLQIIVFTLVSVSFAGIYITQPVLPVLAREFSADMVKVSFTVSAVILGIAVSIIPFGYLADRLPLHRIILSGGLMVAAAGILCSLTESLWLLIGARFLQGIFTPALTTCLAAYLSRTLPAARLNIVMGSYVSATVLGGLGGRFLGGWLHSPLHWRSAFVTSSALVLAGTLMAFLGLPRVKEAGGHDRGIPVGLRHFLGRDFMRIYLCAAGCFFIFSSVFNYLPFRLSGEPFNFSTEMTTALYLVYLVGVFMGTASGRMSHRFGNGPTMISGSLLLLVSLIMIMMPSIIIVTGGLLFLCAGFFTVHASAIGSLNLMITRGHGQANALYVLWYYGGGWSGIFTAGIAYRNWGWGALVFLCGLVLIVPVAASIGELKRNRRTVL